MTYILNDAESHPNGDLKTPYVSQMAPYSLFGALLLTKAHGTVKFNVSLFKSSPHKLYNK